MSESFATAPSSADSNQGVAALTRLTDRIATLVPPVAAAHLARPQPSPAVRAGLAKAQAISRQAARRAARPPRSTLGLAVNGFVVACAFIPYAVVALALRLLMARIFFLDGQTRIEGPRLPLDIYGYHFFSFIAPLHVKAETFTAFLTQYAPLPVPPILAAYLVSYAEFILPIMLVIGLGTRFAALGLLIMTAVISIYILPEVLWSTHIFWFAVLMVLLSQGAGQISLDRAIRFIARR
jgi:putative oxidoreductase